MERDIGLGREGAHVDGATSGGGAERLQRRTGAGGTSPAAGVQLRASDFAIQLFADAVSAGVHPAEQVQRAAAHGLSGAPSSLPHLGAIQQSFGRHDVSGVRAHVGGAAAEGAAAMGAQGYASGDAVAFAGSPDLHLAAHEAAHVVQQRGGVHLKGGVGEVGDPYEQHADAVADLVVQGKSAESLLDTMAGGSATSGVQRAVVQRFGHSFPPVQRAIAAETSLDRLQSARAQLASAPPMLPVTLELGGASVSVAATDRTDALSAIDARAATLVRSERAIAGGMAGPPTAGAGPTDAHTPMSVPDPAHPAPAPTTTAAPAATTTADEPPAMRMAASDITTVFDLPQVEGPLGRLMARATIEVGGHFDLGAQDGETPGITTTARHEHGGRSDRTTLRTSAVALLRDRLAPTCTWAQDTFEFDQGTGGVAVRAGIRFNSMDLPAHSQVRISIGLGDFSIGADGITATGPTIGARMTVPVAELLHAGFDLPGLSADANVVTDIRYEPNWRAVVEFLRNESAAGLAAGGGTVAPSSGAVSESPAVFGVDAEVMAGAGGALLLAGAVAGTWIWLDEIRDSMNLEQRQFRNAHEFAVHAGGQLGTELSSFCSAYRAVIMGTPLDEGSAGARHGAEAARARLDMLLGSYSLEQIREAAARSDVYGAIYAQVLPEFQARAVFLAQAVPVGARIADETGGQVEHAREVMLDALARARTAGH